ncbi:MAG: PHP domain-containing protein, partial [Polyangiaceae bacterium]|nr:PHP domain-containing protein [Polyangiaceae bacterium]
MPAELVHLHVHSQFSFLASTVKIDALIARSAALGMKAVALTDHANMFGAIRHYTKCRAAGIQPILGAELNIARPEGKGVVDHLVVLAADNEGYANLVRLVSQSQVKSACDASPAVTLDDVRARAKGLIGLTGCLGGVAAQRVLEQGPDHGEKALAELSEVFEPGACFVELQDHGFPEQRVVNRILVEASGRLGLPIVATNDVHFLERADGEAHLYLDCIRQNRVVAQERAGHHGSFEMYLKT